MAALSGKNPDYAVIVVDVVEWGSPVAKQFDLHSLPSFQIYGPAGSLELDGKAARQRIFELVGM